MERAKEFVNITICPYGLRSDSLCYGAGILPDMLSRLHPMELIQINSIASDTWCDSNRRSPIHLRVRRCFAIPAFDADVPLQL